MSPILYASCNLDYFRDHGYALAKSSADNQTRLVLEVFPNFGMENIIKVVNEWVSEWPSSIFDYVTIQVVDPVLFYQLAQGTKVTEPRAFYASFRFLSMRRMLEQYDNLLIIDVDALVNKKVELPDGDYDFGLFLRPNEGYGMNVAAGAVYITRRATKFVDHVFNKLLNSRLEWFVDQIALYEAYLENPDLKFMAIPKEVVDWDFNPNSMIFTGKGDRKYTDKTYLKKKKEITGGL